MTPLAQPRSCAGEPTAGDEHDVFVQLADASHRRLATAGNNTVVVECQKDTSIDYNTTWQIEFADYDKFCADGYPQFVGESGGVWHWKVKARPPTVESPSTNI